MSKLLFITIINCALLKNAEHMAYHSNIRSVIENLDPEEIGIPTGIYNPYRAAINVETDIVNKATGSIYTPQMQEADQLRCECFRRIYRKFMVCELEPDVTTQRKAWPVIEKNLVNPYGLSVTQLPLQEKSAVLTGFVLDCRNFLSSEEVKAAGIDGDLDDLDSANQRFCRMYQERLSEKADWEPGYPATCRANTDAAWKLVYTFLNWMANDPTEANKTKAALCLEAVNKINTLTEEARQRLTFRLKANKSFIDKVVVNDDVTLTLPLPMDEIGMLSVVGNKLTADNVKITLLEKSASAGTSKHKVYTVTEFIEKYDGVFELTKDDVTGVETMEITGFSAPTGTATIESVEV